MEKVLNLEVCCYKSLDNHVVCQEEIMGIGFCGKFKCLYRLYSYNKQYSGIAILGYKRYQDGEQTGRDTADRVSHVSFLCLAPTSLSNVSFFDISLFHASPLCLFLLNLYPPCLSPISLLQLFPGSLLYVSLLRETGERDKGTRR